MLILFIFEPLLRYFLYPLLLLHGLCTSLFSQNGITGNPDWQIKPVINQGFILVHRISIGHLVKGYPTNYELNISKPTLGNKLWHLENNKPDVGITLQCLDFKNPSQLGYALTAAPYIEIPLNEKVRPSRLVLRVCLGATYLTKHFDIRDNHKNIAIGSGLNAFVQFKWFWHLLLSERLRLEPGLAFTHASNGKARNPNLGLNVLSLNLGLNFLIPSTRKPEVLGVDSSTKAKSRNELMAYAAIGFNQHEIASERLLTSLYSLAYYRNVRNTHKFGIGVDAYYDQNYFVDYEAEKGKAPEGLEKFRLTVKACYAYNVGRISFPVELGYYVYQKAQPDGNIMSRIGVRYYTRSGLVASFGLRTHFAVAYTFEYGLGYRFYLK